MKKETLELGTVLFETYSQLKDCLTEFRFTRNNINNSSTTKKWKFITFLYQEQQKESNKILRKTFEQFIEFLLVLFESLSDETYQQTLEAYNKLITIPEQENECKEKATEEPEDDVPIKLGKNQCPFGHTFGADHDCMAECDDCPEWSACYNYTKRKNKPK